MVIFSNVQMMQEAVSDYDGSVAVFQDANRKFTSIKDVDARRKRIWLAISKRDIPKVCHEQEKKNEFTDSYNNMPRNLETGK